MAVNQIHQPVCQAGREVRAEVQAAVLAQSPRGINPWEPLADRELDVGVTLVVAQQDVEARLLLLDQVILKRQRFLVVVNHDVFDICGL